MASTPEFTRIRAALAASVHFRDLSPADLDALAALGRIRRLRDGESGARAGTRRHELWIVLNGHMRMTSVSHRGAEMVYAMLGPGSFYGVGSLVAGVKTMMDMRAAGPTSLIVVRGAPFLALLDARPWLWRHIAAMLHRRLTLAVTVVRDLSLAPLAQRIARRLLAQALGSAPELPDRCAIELRLTQSDLGRMLGASRTKVNLELKRLERDGVLTVGYRTIVLRDCGRLRELAGAEVHPL